MPPAKEQASVVPPIKAPESTASAIVTEKQTSVATATSPGSATPPTANSQAQKELDQKAIKIMMEFEGWKPNKEGKHKVHDDGYGIPTIGPGFALIIKVMDKWEARKQDDLKDLRINLSDEQYKIIKDCAAHKSSPDEFTAEEKNKTKSDLKKMSLTVDNETAQRLFDHAVEDSQGKIKKVIGEEAWNKLGHAQQAAVTDYCYHHGNISPIAKFLKGEEKDHSKVVEIMRKDGKIKEFEARANWRADVFESNNLDSPEGTYRIKPRDSLAKVAEDHGISLKELIEKNPGINPDKIQVGQKINIGVKASTNSSYDSIAPHTTTPSDSVIKDNVQNTITKEHEAVPLTGCDHDQAS